MIINHEGVEYAVSTLDGWHAKLYDTVVIDVLQILAYDMGVRGGKDFEDTLQQAPNILTVTYDYFIKFCLTTKADKGDFQKYNIMQLNFVPSKYRKWLDLFNSPGFYELWLNAYNHENKEATEEPDQKKEETGETH